MCQSLIESMTGSEFTRGQFEIALVPVGSTETHGGHLPLATDTYVAYEIAKEVARRVERCVIVPPLFFGMSEHYRHGPFFVSLKADTLVGVLSDVLDSIYSNGIRRVVIINGHDGNVAPIEVAARSFKVLHQDVVVAVLEKWWELAGQLLPQDTFEAWGGLGHAGEAETSICLHLFPKLVRMDEAAGVIPELPVNLDIKWDFGELTDTVATGDPTKATAGKGERMLDVIARAVADFIGEMNTRDWHYGIPRA